MSDQTSILITGDFCPVNRISDIILGNKFDTIFNDFSPIIRNAGLVITNLECPLTVTNSVIKKTGPLLKATVKTAEALSDAGIKLVTLANNHIMDYGLPGLNSTLNACSNNGIDYVGAGLSYNEARQIYYTKLGSYSVAILNFAENEFSTTHGNYPGSNPLDPIENYNDITKAKAKADFVIVIVHGGHEMHNLPNIRIKNTFHFFADAGASAIFLHHAHCYSGYEIYNGVPIFYGLGNFVFDEPYISDSLWNYGFAVNVFLERPITFDIIPYEQCNRTVGIKQLKDHERQKIYANIEHLNSIILNDEILNMEFDRYCNRVKKLYLAYLEPHSIRFFHFLRNRRLFPSLISNRKKTLYLNLLRCESHRDVLIHLLETKEHFNHKVQ